MFLKRQNIVLLFISLGLIFVLAACGDNSEGADGDAGEIELTDEGLPIISEDDELTLEFVAPSRYSLDWNDVLVYDMYEEMSGINIEWEMITHDGLDERTNVMLNTGDYPHAFHSVGFSAHELANYGGQGIFIPIEDMLEEHAPNFTKLMEEYPTVRSAITMPDGHIYSLPRIFDPEFKSVMSGRKLWLKTEFLETLGMDEPKTLDDFYEYLVAVKEENPTGNGEYNEVPLQLSGDTNAIRIFAGSFGLKNRGDMNRHIDIEPGTEDELRFIPTDDRYKEMLQFLNKLYEEELINEDMYTTDSADVSAKGGEGLFASTITTSPERFNAGEYIGAVNLEGPHGDALYGNVKDAVVAPGGFVITDRNPHPEATLRWIDYFYSDEGTKMYFMGKEGLTYEEEEDGSVEYTDEIMENPDGLSYTDAISKYMTWRGVTYPGIVKEAYFKGSEGLPSSIEAAEQYQDGVPEEIWPEFNFDEEESEVMSSIGVDIEDYITEKNAEFITGRKSFDDWDKYVQTIEGMGLDEYMDAYQGAYERYKETVK